MGIISEQAILHEFGRYELHRVAKQELPAAFSPGAQFVKVHIRIDTPSYRQGGILGFDTDEDRAQFHNNIEQALRAGNLIKDGQRAKSSGDYPEDLYIHPDDLSGVVALHKIPVILKALEACPTSSTSWVDIYAFPEGLDQDEKQRRLGYYEPELIRKIIRQVNTQKRRAYRELDVFSDTGLSSYLPGLQFMEFYSRGMGSCSVSGQFLENLLADLIREGLLYMAEQQGHRFYRAPLKGELKSIGKANRGEHWHIVEQVLWSD